MMKINVAEKIRIENPTPAIGKWCKDNLVLDNPDFYKKERMGKWTGNTPRTLSLFERNGEELWLPFGCLQKVWSMCVRGVPWNVEEKAMQAAALSVIDKRISGKEKE